MKKKGYTLIQVIIIILVTSVISGITVGVIATKSILSDKGVNYSEVVTDANVKEFLKVYHEINNDYYEKVDGSKLIDSAINAMIEYLDETYTSYLNENDANILMSQLNGSYNGVGITIKNNVIINVIKDSPADKQGIISGDEIIKINDEIVSDKTNGEIVDIISTLNDSFKITIKRDNNEYEYSLSKESLPIPNVEYYPIENTTIGYLKINVFGNDLSNQVKYALSKLENARVNKLIIDLRNNSGGYLEQAYDTASLFLEKGKVVYKLDDKSGKKEYKDKTVDAYKNPIVVLVNKSTASAAEILTAALKDSSNATIVGVTTYGKGKVQHTYSLSNGSLVKYTSSKWLRPNGECIDEKGIVPDQIIENEYIYDDDNSETPLIIEIIDKQFEKALELLK